MADLSTPQEFRLILDFAIGIADRGLPLAVVRLAPQGDGEVPPGPSLDRLRVAVAYLCRKTDRVTMTGNGQFDVLLVDCNRQGALIFADRVLQGLESWEEVAGVRMGCGIACFAPNLATSEALLLAADEARKRSFEAQDHIEIYGG
ncbi:nucleotidyl cyclase domain-containing protein [Gaopeijia maritima]|uniref:GGDEF domain-containing protein n=1 Tax=Gaopeijia maritima TaxID=3119007 RepID=A0ABU9EGE9_9BACT